MGDNQVKIVSMNCRGLGDAQKRRDVFCYLREKKYNVCLLQDTHFHPNMEKRIQNEWGHDACFASYTSNSRGVVILFNNNFEYKIVSIYKDIGGNFVFVHIKMFEKDIMIVNVYGPNKDDPTFYGNLEERVREMGQFEHVIFGGDWNLVMDYDLDCCNYKRQNNVKAHDQVELMMQNLELVDFWREVHPDLRRYTWRRSAPVQQSRLDFFLITDIVSSFVVDADIKPGYRTDHSIVTLTLQFSKEGIRSPFWKFNSSLLKDKTYLTEINNEINNIIADYAALPYNRLALNEIPLSHIHFVISDQLFLDVLLMKIRSKTISYATWKKRKYEEKEKNIESNIENLENKQVLNDEEKNTLEYEKQELVKIRDYKMKGVLLRSRARWVNEGEKVSAYVCALEKKKFCEQMYE
jgi:exonuclease III